MKIKLGFCYSLIYFLPLIISCSQNANDQVIIDYVYDGDTFKYQNQKIRLFGIDTPETTTGSPYFKPTTGLENLYAQAAKRYAQIWLTNQKVSIAQQSVDQYKRIVAKIFGEDDLGLSLVKSGLARVAYISLEPNSPYYSPDFLYYQKLLEAQYFAYINNVGLWADKASFKIIFPKAN